MSENTTAGIAVLSRADIPKGWRAMSEYVAEGQATYTAVKKAALAGRIESYCLFEGGRMRKRPRRWVNPPEVSAMLGQRETSATLFAEERKPQAPAASPDGAPLALLADALRMLSLEVSEAASSICEAIATAGRREVEPQTFGDS